MSNESSRSIRSPSYPSMGLREAVENVAKIEQSYRTAPVDREIAAKQLGYKSLSGPSAKALAALASFGLLERAGKGETRVTDRARAILYADNDAERIENLIDAASEPALFRDIRDRFDGVAQPPEDGVINFLNRQGFNPNATRPAAKAFLQTMQYLDEIGAFDKRARDGGRHKLPVERGESGKGSSTPKLGDLVQWESDGVLHFPHPVVVRGISDDGEWVFVDGSETGIPASEVTVEESAKPVAQAPPRMPFSSGGDGVEVPGEKEWMRSPLGPKTSVRLMVKGEMGAREVARLIRLLDTQKVILEED